MSVLGGWPVTVAWWVCVWAVALSAAELPTMKVVEFSADAQTGGVSVPVSVSVSEQDAVPPENLGLRPEAFYAVPVFPAERQPPANPAPRPEFYGPNDVDYARLEAFFAEAEQFAQAWRRGGSDSRVHIHCRWQERDEAPVPFGVECRRDEDSPDVIRVVFADWGVPPDSARLRAAMFRAQMIAGGEAERFPDWALAGLEAVFAGEVPPDTRAGAGNWAAPPPLELLAGGRWPKLDTTSEELHRVGAAKVVRNLLWANDGAAFWPFFDQLTALYHGPESGYGHLPPHWLRPLWEAAGYRGPQEWLAGLDADLDVVEWPAEVPVLTAEALGAEHVVLDGTVRPMLQEMAVILRIASKYVAERGSLDPVSWDSAPVRVTRFQNGEIQTTERSAVPEELITPEEERRLENVFHWFTDPEKARTTLDTDGAILSQRLNLSRLEQLFNPEGRRYFLQELDGELVLTATFDTGEALHVVRKPGERRATVSVFAFEGPEEVETPGEKPESGGDM